MIGYGIGAVLFMALTVLWAAKGAIFYWYLDRHRLDTVSPQHRGTLHPPQPTTRTQPEPALRPLQRQAIPSVAQHLQWTAEQQRRHDEARAIWEIRRSAFYETMVLREDETPF